VTEVKVRLWVLAICLVIMFIGHPIIGLAIWVISWYLGVDDD
jgi:hypothetical protein